MEWQMFGSSLGMASCFVSGSNKKSRVPTSVRGFATPPRGSTFLYIRWIFNLYSVLVESCVAGLSGTSTLLVLSFAGYTCPLSEISYSTCLPAPRFGILGLFVQCRATSVEGIAPVKKLVILPRALSQSCCFGCF